MQSAELTEAVLLRNLIHPNIVFVEQAVLQMPPSFKGCGGGALIMPFYENTLLSVIEQPRRERMKHKDVLMYQLLRGVAYCNANGILHRDLKPENCLVDLSNPSLPHLVLTDFGLGEGLVVGCFEKTTIVQTLWYRAPELFLGYDRYNAKIDAWSIGVIWLQYWLDKAPVTKMDDDEQFSEFMRVFGHESKRKEYENLVKKIGAKPNQEWTLDFLIEHMLWRSRIEQEEKKVIYSLLEIDFEKRWSAEQASEDRFFDKARCAVTKSQPAKPLPVYEHCNGNLFAKELPAPYPSVPGDAQLQDQFKQIQPRISVKTFSTVVKWLFELTEEFEMPPRVLINAINMFKRMLILYRQPAMRENIQEISAICLLLSMYLIWQDDLDIVETAIVFSGKVSSKMVVEKLLQDVLTTLDLDLDRPNEATFFEIFRQQPPTACAFNSAMQETEEKGVKDAANDLLLSCATFERIMRWRNSQLAYAALFGRGINSACMQEAAKTYPALYNADVVRQINETKPISMDENDKKVSKIIRFMAGRIPSTGF